MIANRTNKMRVTTPTDCEIVMTREFDAPRSLVWEAFAKPEHVRRWWGRHGDVLTRCDVDFRVGGAWRYHLQSPPDSRENRFKGEYREIHAPEKLVYTFIYEAEGVSDDWGLVTDLFTEKGGRTTLTETMLFPNKEARDQTMATGMAEGGAEALDRLEDLLVDLQQRRSS